MKCFFNSDTELETDYEAGWEWILDADCGSTVAEFTGERLYLGNIRNTEPEHFFDEIFEHSLWETLATETNRYANDRKQRRYNPGKNIILFLSKHYTFYVSWPNNKL